MTYVFGPEEDRERYCFDDGRGLYVISTDEDRKLSDLPFRLLHILLDNRKHRLPATRIFSLLGRHDTERAQTFVENHVRSVRQAFDEPERKSVIKMERNLGYQFGWEVSRTRAPAAGNDPRVPLSRNGELVRTGDQEGSTQVGGGFIGWDEIISILNSMHRKIDADFRPDIILTMSGPGSVAACYCMSIDTRNAPVLVATTFPARQPLSQVVTDFSALAVQRGWDRVVTSKWIVFLPNILDGARGDSSKADRVSDARKILIFDDRVISGDTQRAVATLLTSRGFQVRKAAMLAPPEMADEIDFIGSFRTGDYYLPWGRKRGRY